MYAGPLNRPLIALFFVVCFPFGISEVMEYLYLLHARSFPVFQGKIIQREEIRRWGGIPGGRLTIKIDGVEKPGFAITNKTTAKEMPLNVRFHYTGDPKEEIYIEGEDNPLYVALFLLLTPPILLFVWFFFKGRPGVVGVVE